MPDEPPPNPVTDAPRSSRRELIVAALAGGVALASRPPLARAASRRDPVVVVGAGMAGLAAAGELRRAGLAALVVEARGRVGGRIHTSRAWPGIPLDLGASWIHGYEGNPVTLLARRAGARMLPTSYESAQVHVDPSLAAAGLREPDTERWDELLARARRRSDARETDESVAAAIARETRGVGLTPAEQADLGFHLNAMLVTETGASLDRLSAWEADGDEQFGRPGEDALLPDGLDQLVRWLARGVDVRTGVAVRAIRAHRAGVDLETTAGRISGAGAIVTVPLGVLQAGVIGFSPALPEPVQEAIAALGMGVLSKTFLRFDRAFWPTRVDWHEYVSPTVGAWGEWVSLARAGAPVLMGLNGGEVGRAVEAASPAEVQADALAALRAMFGSSVPRPRALRTTRWSRDALARGSYSFTPVGAVPAHRRRLAQPLTERLVLAGEATDDAYHSTVHGAHRSGVRAARQLIASLR